MVRTGCICLSPRPSIEHLAPDPTWLRPSRHRRHSRNPGSAQRGNTQLFDRVLATEVGSGAEFRTFMDEELFDKLGMW